MPLLPCLLMVSPTPSTSPLRPRLTSTPPLTKAFALNAASKAAFAKFEFDYTTTSAATKAAAGACFYSRCVVPPRCTHLLYSTSLRMPICRILNPIPYVSTHALEKGMRGGDPSALRSTSVSAQNSAVASSRESSVLALATTDIPSPSARIRPMVKYSLSWTAVPPSTSYNVALSSPMLRSSRRSLQLRRRHFSVHIQRRPMYSAH
jgi:hypothetical protein